MVSFLNLIFSFPAFSEVQARHEAPHRDQAVACLPASSYALTKLTLLLFSAKMILIKAIKVISILLIMVSYNAIKCAA
jgi:hypothetical protein